MTNEKYTSILKEDDGDYRYFNSKSLESHTMIPVKKLRDMINSLEGTHVKITYGYSSINFGDFKKL